MTSHSLWSEQSPHSFPGLGKQHSLWHVESVNLGLWDKWRFSLSAIQLTRSSIPVPSSVRWFPQWRWMHNVGNKKLFMVVLVFQKRRHWLKVSAQLFLLWTDHKNLKRLKSIRTWRDWSPDRQGGDSFWVVSGSSSRISLALTTTSLFRLFLPDPSHPEPKAPFCRPPVSWELPPGKWRGG